MPSSRLINETFESFFGPQIDPIKSFKKFIAFKDG